MANESLKRKAIKKRIRVERRTLELPRELLNEAAKPPCERIFKTTSLEKMLFTQLEKVGLNPKSPVDTEAPGCPFTGFVVSVPVEDEVATPDRGTCIVCDKPRTECSRQAPADIEAAWREGWEIRGLTRDYDEPDLEADWQGSRTCFALGRSEISEHAKPDRHVPRARMTAEALAGDAPEGNDGAGITHERGLGCSSPAPEAEVTGSDPRNPRMGVASASSDSESGSPGLLRLDELERKERRVREAASTLCFTKPIVRKGDDQPDACREAFERWNSARGVSIEMDSDAWGRPRYRHSHVDSMWHGFEQGWCMRGLEREAAQPDDCGLAVDAFKTVRSCVETYLPERLARGLEDRLNRIEESLSKPKRESSKELHPAVLEDIIRGALEAQGIDDCGNPIRCSKAIMAALSVHNLIARRKSLEEKSGIRHYLSSSPLYFIGGDGNFYELNGDEAKRLNTILRTQRRGP